MDAHKSHHSSETEGRLSNADQKDKLCVDKLRIYEILEG